MGLNITAKNASFTHFLPLNFPFGKNLTGLWDLTGSDIEAARVSKVTGVPATIIGNPQPVDNGFKMSKDNRLITDISIGSGDTTLVAAFKYLGGSLIQPIGTASAEIPSGVGINMYPVGVLRININGVTNLDITPDKLEVNDVVIVVATIAANKKTLTFYRNGIKHYYEKTSPAIQTEPGYINIGYSNSSSSPLDIYFCASYEGALSEEGVEMVYNAVNEKIGGLA